MSVVSFARALDAPLARPRFNAFLLNLFGAAALFLAGIGQYAVIAAYVRQREREIALRVALGASPAKVRWLVLAEALRLAAVGAVIGLIGAAAVSRLLRGLLFEVGSFDPITLTGAVLLLGAASVVAAWLPLRRALRVDATAMLKA
jgi:ABC-type antimicrobial peptide transport system permease subunit